jgi:NADH dehydrogenase/NADH:ubiquinone oxidoreductase subunit G
MSKVNLTIDEQSITVPSGITILDAAKTLGIDIPAICYHEACTANALCRLCVVEVEGASLLAPSCIAEVSEGMKVHTRSESVERSRRTIMELLDSAVDLSESPEILEFLSDYAADRYRFPGAEQREKVFLDDNPMFTRDYSQCVLCWRCVQVCAEDAQYTYAINFAGRGFETQITTFFEKPLPETTCVFCGQCIGVCPTGALKSKREWLFEQGITPDEIMQVTS